MENFLDILQQSITGYYVNFVELLPKILIAVLVFIVLFFISNWTKNIVNTRLVSRSDNPLLVKFIGRIVKYVIVIAGLLIALQIIGYGGIATGILSSAGVGAFIIGFAFKDIGENFLAGILMAFNRPFKIGDIVELNGQKGKVLLLNLRNTQIKSFDGKDIFIPNANIIKNPVINYTIDGFLRYDFNVGLDYGSDVSEAGKIILRTLQNMPGILQDKKPPSVMLGSLDASTFTLTAYYWLNTYDPSINAGEIKTKAVDTVLTNLNDAGFYLPGNILEMKPYEGGTAALNEEKKVV